MGLLQRSSRRYLLRHPWQMGLSTLGVALAVAVVVGIDLANASATKAFRLSVEGVAGRATHEIAAGPGGVDEALYARLRLDGWRRTAPVVEGWVTTPGISRPLRVFGIDPFAEDLFRGFTRSLDASERSGDLSLFLTQPGAALLSEELARELGLGPGESFAVGGRERRLVVAGLLAPESDLARQTSRDLLVLDVAGAQELLDRVGRLSRIDLVLDADEAERLGALLPPGVELAEKSARAGTLDQMTRAFRLNLQALSLLALLVGMFLIYNTTTFSVVARRPLIGILRALGVTRGEVFRLVLSEAALVALVGSAAGLVLGVALARVLLELVVRTINDLYFVLTVQGVGLPLSAVLKGLFLGLGGTVLAALAPAHEATRAPPRAVLQRSWLEGRTRQALPRLTAAGLLLAAASGGLLAIPSKDLYLSFAAIFLFTLGYACLVPALTFAAMHVSRRPMRRLFGILGAMAARGVSATLSRTGVAMAALVIAVAMTVGVAIMVQSFRATLVDWLDVRLQADVYVAPTDAGRETIDPSLVESLARVPGVEHAITYRRVEVSSPRGPTRLTALGLERPAFEMFRFAAGGGDEAWRSFQGGAVLVSEPFAYHHDVAAGDEVELLTDRGPRRFEVAGVFYDYASDRGAVVVDRAVYDRYWDDPRVHSLGLFASEGLGAEALTEALRAVAAGRQELRITPNAALRRAALQIFDRTFVITGVLRLLGVAVAFLGVLSALMALQLERSRELGVLRANGLTPGQVWGLVTAQTGLMGLVSGFFAAPLGVLLATLLVHVINRRSFGWTLRMEVRPEVLVQAVLLALVAALLAGLWPAYKMSRSSPAWALREE